VAPVGPAGPVAPFGPAGPAVLAVGAVLAGRAFFAGGPFFARLAFGTRDAGRTFTGRFADDLAGRFVEDQLRRALGVAEFEHVVDAARVDVLGAGADRAEAPVLLDELQDRRLLGERVVDVVRLRVRRDQHERKPRAKPTTTGVFHLRAFVGEMAGADTGEAVSRGVRREQRRADLMVIPTIGVVVGDEDRRVVPVLRVLDRVDLFDEEFLFVEWIGVGGVAVLGRRRLEEGDLRHVPRFDGLFEPFDVVLVVDPFGPFGARRIAEADLAHRARRGVLEVGRALVVLERLVVHHVAGDRGTADVLHRLGAERTGTFEPARFEAALEPAPGDAAFVQQVTDVPAGHFGGRTARQIHHFAFDFDAFERVFRFRRFRVGALVVTRFGVTLQHTAFDVAVRGGTGFGAFGVTADQVDRARGGRTELVVVGVVVQRVVLGVVPECGDGVAVVVIHHDAGTAVFGAVFRFAYFVAAAAGGFGDEFVHQPVVVGFLLRRVAVVLVAGQRFVVSEAFRICFVRVFVQQAFAETVDRRRAREGGEGRFPGPVHGVRVGAEVVIERDVLREENDDVFDRGRRGRQCGGRRRGRAGHRDADDGRPREYRGSTQCQQLLAHTQSRLLSFLLLETMGRGSPDTYASESSIRPVRRLSRRSYQSVTIV
jgi:hypothetical protein